MCRVLGRSEESLLEDEDMVEALWTGAIGRADDGDNEELMKSG